MTCVLYILCFKFLEFNKYCVLLFLHYPTIKCNTFLWHLRCSSHLFLVWCKILQILAEVFLQQFQASHPLMRDKRLGPGRGFGQQQGIHNTHLVSQLAIVISMLTTSLFPFCRNRYVFISWLCKMFSNFYFKTPRVGKVRIMVADGAVSGGSKFRTDN